MVLKGSDNANFSRNEHASSGGELFSSSGDGDSVDMKKIESWHDDIEASNNKTSFKLTPKPEQEKLVDMMKQLGPLGLKLTISPYFMNSLNSILSSQAQETNSHSRHRNYHHHHHHHLHHHRRDSHHKMVVVPHQPHHPRHEEYVSQPPSTAEKMKAANFPALSLKIGSWERVTIHEGDLVAKCYYAKRKLVWEFLEQRLKRKVEIQWGDITAIKTILKENEPGILQIELRQPPNFYDEIDPQPRKHTNWRPAEDFTGGQALMCRRHFLKFPAGVLDKHYEKLLQCDNRLFQLSQQPFPSSKHHYFPRQDQIVYNFADYSNNFKHNRVSSLNIEVQQLQAAYHQHIINPPLFSLDSPNSVIELARMADQNGGSIWGGNQREFQVQGVNPFAAESVPSEQVQGPICNMASTDTTGFVYQNNNNNNYVGAEMLLNEIENNILINSSNQEYCQDSVAPMDALMYNTYQAGNPVSNIATNQHLGYDHHTAQQHLADSTDLGYPPYPISWVAQPQQQPISVAALPQNMCQDMSQAVSVAAMHPNMTHAIMSAQALSMGALAQNEAPVNLPESIALDEMMGNIYH